MKSTRTRRKAIRSMVAAVLAGLVAMTGFAPIAEAAEIGVIVSNPKLEGELRVGKELKFSVDLATPAGSIVRSGDTFTVTLPAPLRLVSSAPFELTDDAGNPVADCRYQVDTNPQEIECAFVNDEPIRNWDGGIWFLVTPRAASEETTLTFVINEEIEVEFPGPITGPNPGNPNPSEPGLAKGGSATGDRTKLEWWVNIPSSVTNQLHEQDSVTITDTLVNDDPEFQPQYYWRGDTGYPYVSCSPVTDGSYNPNGWTRISPGAYTVSYGPEGSEQPSTMTFTFADGANIPANHLCQIRYRTRPLGDVMLPGDKFRNSVEVNGRTLNSNVSVRATGGGTGDGQRYVSFALTKQVAGEAAQSVDEGVSFTVKASVAGLPDRTLSVTNGSVAPSGRFPVGSTIVISELDLPEVPGVVWGVPALSGPGVTANPDGTWSITPEGGEVVELLLVNTANPGSVSVGDYVWLDTNRDGVQDDGEPGIGGVTLTLTGPGGQPVTDVAGDPVPPVQTDEAGAYLFSKLPVLPEGGYTVTVTPPAGYFPTTAEATDRASDSSTGKATSVSLPEDGDSDLTLDFGFITYEPAIGVVKTDENGHDANLPTEAVNLTDSEGETGLVFTITNTGNERLTDVLVSDAIDEGTATVTDLTCTFPDGSSGTSWEGPFEVGASFTCTATLAGVVPGSRHADTVTVTGKGEHSGTPVTDDDPYHAFVAPVGGEEDEDPEPPGPGNELPMTGADLAGLGAIAGLALIGGVAALLVRRRR